MGYCPFRLREVWGIPPGLVRRGPPSLGLLPVKRKLGRPDFSELTPHAFAQYRSRRMNEGDKTEDGLFPEWEKENPPREDEVSQEAMWGEFARFCREMLQPDRRGYLSTCQAARVMGVSEAYVRELIGKQKLRRTWYPLIKLNAVWATDVKAYIDAKRRKAKEAKQKPPQE
jgi:hypothetical protein